MSEPNQKPTFDFDTIFVLKALSDSSHTALLSLVLKIVDRIGMNEIDGLSVADWYEMCRKSALQNILIRAEDGDPTRAAAIQKILDALQPPSV